MRKHRRRGMTSMRSARPYQKKPDLLCSWQRQVVLCRHGSGNVTPGGIPGQPSFMDMAAQTDTQLDDTIAHYQRFFRLLRDLPQISIALVQGHAIGAGFQIALACDFIIAEPRTVFALKEAQWGLTPDLGGTVRFMEKLGYHKSLELIGSGRDILAEEALSAGIDYWNTFRSRRWP